MLTQNLASLVSASMTAGMGLMATGLVAESRCSSAARRWLLVLLAATLAVCLGDGAIAADAPGLLRWVEPFSDAALLLLGPAVWLYANTVVREPGKPERPSGRPGLHLVPAGMLAALLLISAAIEPAPALPKFRSAGELWSLLPVGAQLLVYWLALWRFTAHLHVRLKERYSQLAERNLLWLQRLLLIYALTLAAWAATWNWPVAWSNTLTDGLLGVAVFVITLFGSRQTEVSIAAPQEAATSPSAPKETKNAPADSGAPRYAKAPLSPERAERIGTTLDRLMREEKPHLHMDLTLDELAARLGTGAHLLSQYFSIHRKTSYYDFINSWRVEEVKAVLACPDAATRSLLDIAFACGFGSKSAFNAVFKRHTGVSPKNYRAKKGHLAEMAQK